jgi:hypothetical protein
MAESGGWEYVNKKNKKQAKKKKKQVIKEEGNGSFESQ